MICVNSTFTQTRNDSARHAWTPRSQKTRTFPATKKHTQNQKQEPLRAYSVISDGERHHIPKISPFFPKCPRLSPFFHSSSPPSSLPQSPPPRWRRLGVVVVSVAGDILSLSLSLYLLILLPLLHPSPGFIHSNSVFSFVLGFFSTFRLV